MSNRPATKRIACDECPVLADGDLIYPHQGQWLDLIPVSTIREMFVMREYATLNVDIAAAEGDTDETRALSQKLMSSYGEILGILADRITGWNWTDAAGRKLGKPTAENMQRLSLTEMWWLVRVLQTNGASATAGKDLSDTPTTSSDSSPQPDPTTSSTAPSPEAAS